MPIINNEWGNCLDNFSLPLIPFLFGYFVIVCCHDLLSFRAILILFGGVVRHGSLAAPPSTAVANFFSAEIKYKSDNFLETLLRINREEQWLWPETWSMVSYHFSEALIGPNRVHWDASLLLNREIDRSGHNPKLLATELGKA